MPFYVADYLSDTRHLSTEEHGAYLLLLMAMWRAGGRLPNEAAKLARITGLSAARWAKLEADILAFFDVHGDEIGHGRIQKEFEKYSRTSGVRAEAGSRGGKAKALKNNKTTLAKATILPEQTPNKNLPYQISEPEKIEDANASLSPQGDEPVKYHADFEVTWKAYPHVKGRSSKPKSYGYWRRIPAETRLRLPAAIERYKARGREPNGDCGAPAMERWIRDRRFLDWLDDTPDEPPAAPRATGPPSLTERMAAEAAEARRRVLES